ncbi:VOC family protein [Actinoplanes sp. NPDC023801]|uniref:VOC family protein n=1 Tax=Actinoplanes sp. NPDC023801 TaxID=3154595 RepID=UPI0033EE1280
MPGHGTVNWFDIRTPDPDASQAFGAALFGWSFRDFELGDGGASTIWLGDQEIGLMTRAQGPAGSPATVLYVYVEDLTGTVDRARELGAKVTVEPVFVDEETGAFADLVDPAGVTIGLWGRTL